MIFGRKFKPRCGSKCVRATRYLYSCSTENFASYEGHSFPVLRIPGFHAGSRISDHGFKNSNKREGRKKICSTFFCSHKNHKIENYINIGDEKIWTNLQRIIELYTQKLPLSSQNYGFGIRDQGSGIREKPIPDPGSRSWGQKSTGSRIRIRNTAHFSSQLFRHTI